MATICHEDGVFLSNLDARVGPTVVLIGLTLGVLMSWPAQTLPDQDHIGLDLCAA